MKYETLSDYEVNKYYVYLHLEIYGFKPNYARSRDETIAKINEIDEMLNRMAMTPEGRKGLKGVSMSPQVFI